MSRRMRFALIVSAVVIVVGGAIAMAAVRMSGESDSAKGLERSGLAKNEVAGVESASESSTKASPFGEDVAAEGDGPGVASNEAYALNAYPADTIPFSATQNSIQAWNSINGKGVGKGKNTPGQWTLAGPSTANFPSTLTFSGASYTTSGRITALAAAPTCSPSKCRVYAAAAGGGVWRTDNALSGSGPNWTFVSGTFGTNAIGTLYLDPTDPSGNTVYAGTGEANASGDSGAGLGLYKTTDGGNTWTHLLSTVTGLTTPGNGTYTGDAFAGRSIAGVAVDPTNPNVIYVASTRGVHGVASVTAGATTNPPTPRPPFGLFKSTDGGATFSFIWDGNASIRGVTDLALDPSNSNIVYAAAYDQGTWRSFDGGTTWSLLKARLTAADPDRPSFDVTKLPNGNTRMYLGEGAAGTPQARFFRTDDASGASPVWTDLTTAQNINYCTGQCWYDNVVYTPPGKPDVVYLGGSYDYGNYGHVNNGRAFLRSTDAGQTFTDMTWDATTDPTPAGSCCQPNPIAPNGMHPDQHAVVELPGTDAAIFGSDGGLMRSSGSFSDISSQCAARGLSGGNLTLCQGLLSAVPSHLYSLNKGLSTLQFQSVRIDPANPKHLQGGTQDNGTFETYGSAVVWPQIIYGDGGQSGFSATNSALRFNTFTGQASDVNFQNGDPSKWVIATGPIVSSPEGAYFYPPVISDPVAGGTIFQGSFSVWRTQDWGGNQAYLEANCPEFTTSAANPACGDFVRMGAPGATDLTRASLGSRAGGAVSAIARTPSDTGTVWAATGGGRVFISKNGDAPAASVVWTRLDSLPSATASPSRAISGIYVDPANANHAYISYFGYNFNTPTTPGHVFSVTYNPGAGTAVWTSLDNPGGTAFPDFPANDVAYDSVTGDLYAANDFGVMRLASGSTSWTVAGAGMPMVEVSGLSIDPNSRELIAATHGRSAWKLTLP